MVEKHFVVVTSGYLDESTRMKHIESARICHDLKNVKSKKNFKLFILLEVISD